MSSRILRLAVASLLLTPVFATTQEKGPQLTFQIQSVDSLGELVRQAANNFLPKREAEAVAEKVGGILNPMAAPGIDFKRAIGGYGTFDPRLAKSIEQNPDNPLAWDLKGTTFILMAPIADDKQFKETLANFGIVSMERKDGSYVINLPFGGIDVKYRFAKGYLYAGLGDDENFTATGIADIKQVIDDKEKGVLVVREHYDRMSKEMLAKSQEMDKGIAQLREVIGDHPAIDELVKLGKRWGGLIVEGGKLGITRVTADPKTAELGMEFVIVPKAQSKLATELAALKPATNSFGSLLKKDAFANVAISPPLHIPEIRAAAEAGIKTLKEKMPQHPDADKHAVHVALIEALERTIKAGNLDFAATMRGPNAAGNLSAVGVLRVQEPGTALDKFRAAFTKGAPEFEKKLFTFDAQKIGGISVHEAAVRDQDSAKLAPIFGKNLKVYFAAGPGAFYMAMGADGPALIKEAIEAKPGPASIAQADYQPEQATRLIAKFANIADDPDVKEMATKLGKLGQVRAFAVDVEGGQHFRVRLSLSGTAIPLMLHKKLAHLKDLE